AALKGAAPFEVRALALRAITGAPAAGAFTAGGQGSADEWPVAAQIAKRVAEKLANDTELAPVLAQTFRL
ncbi:MAG: SDR family NAD(P)-dependent oxidoreductase, partial [Novosphingobium sp.]|nr:SDR family NAD(P)-dependent oxidoreductase [Novosphingobium sp.]